MSSVEPSSESLYEIVNARAPRSRRYEPYCVKAVDRPFIRACAARKVHIASA